MVTFRDEPHILNQDEAALSDENQQGLVLASEDHFFEEILGGQNTRSSSAGSSIDQGEAKESPLTIIARANEQTEKSGQFSAAYPVAYKDSAEARKAAESVPDVITLNNKAAVGEKTENDYPAGKVKDEALAAFTKAHAELEKHATADTTDQSLLTTGHKQGMPAGETYAKEEHPLDLIRKANEQTERLGQFSAARAETDHLKDDLRVVEGEGVKAWINREGYVVKASQPGSEDIWVRQANTNEWKSQQTGQTFRGNISVSSDNKISVLPGAAGGSGSGSGQGQLPDRQAVAVPRLETKEGHPQELIRKANEQTEKSGQFSAAYPVAYKDSPEARKLAASELDAIASNKKAAVNEKTEDYPAGKVKDEAFAAIARTQPSSAPDAVVTSKTVVAAYKEGNYLPSGVKDDALPVVAKTQAEAKSAVKADPSHLLANPNQDLASNQADGRLVLSSPYPAAAVSKDIAQPQLGDSAAAAALGSGNVSERAARANKVENEEEERKHRLVFGGAVIPQAQEKQETVVAVQHSTVSLGRQGSYEQVFQAQSLKPLVVRDALRGEEPKLDLSKCEISRGFGNVKILVSNTVSASSDPALLAARAVRLAANIAKVELSTVGHDTTGGSKERLILTNAGAGNARNTDAVPYLVSFKVSRLPEQRPLLTEIVGAAALMASAGIRRHLPVDGGGTILRQDNSSARAVIGRTLQPQSMAAAAGDGIMRANVRYLGDAKNFVAQGRVDHVIRGLDWRITSSKRCLTGAEIAFVAALTAAGIARVRADHKSVVAHELQEARSLRLVNVVSCELEKGVVKSFCNGKMIGSLDPRLIENFELSLENAIVRMNKAKLAQSSLDKAMQAPRFWWLQAKSTEDQALKSSLKVDKTGITSTAGFAKTLKTKTLNKSPVLTRPTWLVSSGETLVSIAESLFNDANLGWLIADLNCTEIMEYWMDGKRVVELRSRQRLYLPVWQDIVDFYKIHPAGSTPDKLITIVTTNPLDREIVDNALASVMGICSRKTSYPELSPCLFSMSGFANRHTPGNFVKSGHLLSKDLISKYSWKVSQAKDRLSQTVFSVSMPKRLCSSSYLATKQLSPIDFSKGQLLSTLKYRTST